MKNKMKTGLLAAALLAFCASGFAADLKIAVVDVRKVFDGYYKTVQANMVITNEAAEMQKGLNAMVADADKVKDLYKQAFDRANDQAISSDEREKSKMVAQQKLVELQSMQSEIEQYNSREQSRLAEKRRQRIDTIVGEIREVLSAKAKAGGFTLVLDKSGETIPGVPLVLFSNGENDLTEALLKDLNATAPVAPAPEAKPGAKQDAK
jgi:Skp family chaperone for outer membrane proteins